MNDIVRRYTYRIQWSDEDGEYAATVLEFPGLSWLASNELEALQGLHMVVEEAVKDLQEDGERVPTPINDKHYSGKFMLRITPEEHRRLALAAAEQHVSINRYAEMKLAEA
ncbi:MAG: type II toxin-antitoxin system HicB family antitoxin [Bifidobacterium tibiigranuli]|jgi:predicted HicB family RNase H-like nuclease|uniref:type II toxin-antitoxin system HicB family antitoxin n=1 Tax=Bifidobacterium tibiigranuli TaxID=2172043 RepID=UPI0026EEF1A6|nr:type II toxin-antitoxin system HicB family antitoxin [Bifidobacterium tibiigranuli]MCI1674584.1 type II toxin-antitoxin system HicB family antitoxin [Bifidobacterium tibiigranuli]MCI1714128.1 type II toxin-antitoxin system HicB family antitoxin [Bifidobacterium tibiigranuli]